MVVACTTNIIGYRCTITLALNAETKWRRLYLEAKSICECESYSTDLMNMSANSVASGVPTGVNTKAADNLAVETMVMVC